MLACGDRVHAFRIIWRVDSDHLAHAWDAIVTRRQLCDQVVAKTPSVQMFVSCISGVFNKTGTPGKWRSQQKPVYPAVSYWVVYDSTETDVVRQLVVRLLAVCSSIQCKAITSTHHRRDEPMAANCGTLFVALKDHNSSFIDRKIHCSLLARGALGATSHSRNANLNVLSHSKYRQQMPTSVAAMQGSGLYIQLHVFEEDGRTAMVFDS